MKYLLLIYQDEAASARMNEEQQNALTKDYTAFMNELQQSGAMRGGEALQSTTAATTVRVRNGKPLTTDGPFAETKEQLGGYFVVECQDLDQAIKIASMIPDAKGGSVEVRPVADVGM